MATRKSSMAMATLAAAALLPSISAATAWHMRPVKSLQARVETFAPVWDEEHGVWVSGVQLPGVKMSFEDRYLATMDSVTTSSVEGALMYLQRDCIDIGARPWESGCQRRNNVSVITFMEVQIANPNAALAEYQTDRYSYPEFCPFVEMKNGQCIFTNDTVAPATVVTHPPECKQYNGIDGQPNIGPCVGAQAFPTDNIAPYFDTVWFSYPGSCPMATWADGKNTTCRKENPGGLCPFGTEPDGVKCSFAYKILGYITIDDLVGITSTSKQPKIISSSNSQDDDDGEDDDDGVDADADDDGSGSGSVEDDDDDSPYPNCINGPCFENYREFCQANNTEFHSFDKDKTLGLRDVRSIEFWGFPSDHRVNKNRTAFMISLYNKKAAERGSNMAPLPLDLDALSEANPPCYENSLECYESRYGCRRHSYGQVCSVCKEMGAKCVMKIPAYDFPDLKKADRTVSDSELRSRQVRTPAAKDPAKSKSAASGVVHSLELLILGVMFVGMWC